MFMTVFPPFQGDAVSEVSAASSKTLTLGKSRSVLALITKKKSN